MEADNQNILFKEHVSISTLKSVFYANDQISQIRSYS